MTHPVLVTLRWRSGDREVIRVPTDRSVLEGAENAGVELPFGCRIGVCGTCTGRCLDGAVTHTREPRALDDTERADGYVLPCVAAATTDCTLEVGVDVRTDLYENPWK